MHLQHSQYIVSIESEPLSFSTAMLAVDTMCTEARRVSDRSLAFWVEAPVGGQEPQLRPQCSHTCGRQEFEAARYFLTHLGVAKIKVTRLS